MSEPTGRRTCKGHTRLELSDRPLGWHRSERCGFNLVDKIVTDSSPAERARRGGDFDLFARAVDMRDESVRVAKETLASGAAPSAMNRRRFEH